MVRLPHHVADNKKFLRALEAAGADGICTIESIRGISGVDIVNARPLMPDPWRLHRHQCAAHYPFRHCGVEPEF